MPFCHITEEVKGAFPEVDLESHMPYSESFYFALKPLG